jgi:hypothetical protein
VNAKQRIGTIEGMYVNLELGPSTGRKYFVMVRDPSPRKAPLVFPSAIIRAITEFVTKSRKGFKGLD